MQNNHVTIQELIDRSIPKEIEPEGGGSFWYMVCPECHGAVCPTDRFCRYCGQALKNEKAGKWNA